MNKLTTLDWIAFILVIVGGLNWGLTVFGWNVVGAIFSWSTTILNIVYILVGLSALYLLFTMGKFSRK